MTVTLHIETLTTLISKVGHHFGIINPRRACARVTVVVLCVCLSVCYRSSGYSIRLYLNQTTPTGSLRLYLILGILRKPSIQELWREKANMQMS